MSIPLREVAITSVHRLELRRVRSWMPPVLTDEEIDRLFEQDCVPTTQLALELPGPADRFAPRKTPGADLPDARGFLRQLVPALLESRLGQRPAGQLLRWLSPPIQQQLTRQHATAQRRGLTHTARPVVRKVHLCALKDDLVEASVVAVWGGRTRALALRLVGTDGRWVITALEIG
jgi:hypothetical protein